MAISITIASGWNCSILFNLSRLEIYRRDRDREILENPMTVSGEDVFREFILELSEIFTS